MCCTTAVICPARTTTVTHQTAVIQGMDAGHMRLEDLGDAFPIICSHLSLYSLGFLCCTCRALRRLFQQNGGPSWRPTCFSGSACPSWWHSLRSNENSEVILADLCRAPAGQGCDGSGLTARQSFKQPGCGSNIGTQHASLGGPTAARGSVHAPGKAATRAGGATA